MQIKEEFEKLIENLKVKNAEDISVSYKGVTKKLNQTYYGSESESDNSLQVGSYGRDTAADGISDLDMIFDLPSDMYTQYDEHEGNGQSALLQDVRQTLKDRYPTSDISVDGQVVIFDHTNYKIELVPAFKEADGSYTFPDTNDGGSWKITKPKEEIKAIEDFDGTTNGVLKKLCQMTRAWKDHVGAPMGGLLIDTLCHDFLKDNENFHNIEIGSFGEMSKAFFDYLANTDPNRTFWYAPGSNQQVYSKGNFVPKAKKALKYSEKALENTGKEVARKHWKKIFGRKFPVKEDLTKSLSEATFRNTEQFIEDLFPVNISENLIIDCTVTQNGFRNSLLSMGPFLRNKFSLEFFVNKTTAREPFDVYWKVRNIGPVAEKRDCIRGQIVKDEGFKKKKETSNFDGDHFVECYIVKNGVVVARDMIDVNITDVES